ncbi:MAG: hypothetical protein JW801_10790 [Bacteroidales bacterium]|nr:hypothetical protein [Bacteroidales bacterium]
MSKNTLKVYLQKLYLIRMIIDELLAPEDPELEKKFHGGNPADKDPRFEYWRQKLTSIVSDRFTGVKSYIGEVSFQY